MKRLSNFIGTSCCHPKCCIVQCVVATWSFCKLLRWAHFPSEWQRPRRRLAAGVRPLIGTNKFWRVFQVSGRMCRRTTELDRQEKSAHTPADKADGHQLTRCQHVKPTNFPRNPFVCRRIANIESMFTRFCSIFVDYCYRLVGYGLSPIDYLHFLVPWQATRRMNIIPIRSAKILVRPTKVPVQTSFSWYIKMSTSRGFILNIVAVIVVPGESRTTRLQKISQENEPTSAVSISNLMSH